MLYRWWIKPVVEKSLGETSRTFQSSYLDGNLTENQKCYFCPFLAANLSTSEGIELQLLSFGEVLVIKHYLTFRSIESGVKDSKISSVFEQNLAALTDVQTHTWSSVCYCSDTVCSGSLSAAPLCSVSAVWSALLSLGIPECQPVFLVSPWSEPCAHFGNLLRWNASTRNRWNRKGCSLFSLCKVVQKRAC